MSIQEARADFLVSTRRSKLTESGGEMLPHVSFEQAAAVSYGAHDTPEQQAQRVEVARALEAAMIPGEQLLFQESRLEVVGGCVTMPPQVVRLPSERGSEYAFTFTLQSDGSSTERAMRFRDLVYGTRPGAPVHLPSIAVGREAMERHLLAQYVESRLNEEGRSWGVSYTTELRTYAALTSTDVRMCEVLTASELEPLRNRVESALLDPRNKHIEHTLRAALRGMGAGEGLPDITLEPESHWRGLVRKTFGAIAVAGSGASASVLRLPAHD